MADFSSLLGAAGIGGAIGKAIVSLELETTKYQAELKAAQTQTAAGTSTMGSSFSKFGGLAQTALLGVGAAAVAGAALSVKAAIEANEAHLKLQNTFENNASISDSSVEAFEAQAESLRALTGVDDEAIITSQALLAQFDLTGQQVMELTPLIVDLSEKMDIDLQAATKAVGKATQGNAGILSRYGIVLDETALQTDAFAETTRGLAVVQGFAADRAKDEPWRVLGSTFEEIAEQVGQALLPAIQSLAEALLQLAPIIEGIAKGIQFLPLVQMSETLARVRADTEDTGKTWKDYADIVFDSVPVLGNFIDIAGRSADEMAAQRGLIGDLSDYIHNRYVNAIQVAGAQTSRFAHLTRKELREWSDDVKESFDAFIFVLDESAETTKITRREFIDATDAMQREARQLARAMREIAGEKWINDEYIKFLSEQGPEWLIGFTKLTESEQRKAQDAWGESTKQTDKAKDSLDRITGVLDKMDKGETKHKVTIEYEYVGFDPSKPGMSDRVVGGRT